MILNWDAYQNFSAREFDDRTNGRNAMQPEFMEVLQGIRNEFNRPMPVTSGYRHKTHPIEASKPTPGEHSFGVAADINVYGLDALELIDIAFKHGVRRIGVKQHGEYTDRYIHIGIGDRRFHFPQSVWTY